MNKMEIATYLSIITLNINGLNVPIKRYRVAEWRIEEHFISKQQNTPSFPGHIYSFPGWSIVRPQNKFQ